MHNSLGILSKFIFSIHVRNTNCSDACASRSFESDLFKESIEPVHKTVLKDSFALKILNVGRKIVTRSRHVHIRIMIKDVSFNFSSMCIFTKLFKVNSN